MMMNRKKISSTGGWRRTRSGKDNFCLTDTVSKNGKSESDLKHRKEMYGKWRMGG